VHCRVSKTMFCERQLNVNSLPGLRLQDFQFAVFPFDGVALKRTKRQRAPSRLGQSHYTWSELV